MEILSSIALENQGTVGDKRDLIINRNIENMRTQTSDNVKIGNIRYFTELKGDAPISVYVISGEKGYNITDIFITHAHPDHDWNAARFKQLFNARIWLGKEDLSLIRNFADQPQTPTHSRFVSRVKWISFWTKTPLFKSKHYVPDILIDENANEVAKQYGYDIEFVHLPGHTKGSYGILKDGVLYAGDSYAVLNGTPMEPPHAYSIEEMKDSVRKISELSPEYLACGHGVPFLFADHKM